MRGLSWIKWLSLLLGILLLFAGISFLKNPLATTFTLVELIGIIFISLGVLRIVRYFSHRVFKTSGFLVGGILDLVMGILILRNLESSTLGFTILIGFWIISTGVIDLVTSLELKDFRVKSWWLQLINGLIGIILGFLLIGNFNLSTIYITIIISSYMIISGLTLIFTFLAITRLMKYNRYY